MTNTKNTKNTKNIKGSKDSTSKEEPTTNNIRDSISYIQQNTKSIQCDIESGICNNDKCDDDKCSDDKCDDECEYMKLYNTGFIAKQINSPLFQRIRGACSQIAGVYYCTVHMLFMILTGIIIYFVTNKVHLCMLLLVISLDAFANVVFFDCPLSSLEKKYMNTSMIETRLNALQKYGMMYSNNKYYDTQLEVIINGWTICASKILMLIVFDWMNIPY